MATTTPNFGWSVPTSSDLVKNGAVAIETLGDSIDASLVDLKGGTTGQVLAKATNTDMDFTWTTSSAGMTNPMTTTGDTIYSSSGSTPARLGIGSTGQVLTVSGGVPSWATPASGSTFVGVSLFNTSSQSIPDSTGTMMTFNSETYDTDGFHSTSSNTDRITIPSGKAGKYLLTGIAYWSANSNGFRLNDFQLNGSTLGGGMTVMASSGAATTAGFSQVVNLAVGDYVTIRAYQTSGGNLNNNGTFNGSFTATYLGA